MQCVSHGAALVVAVAYFTAAWLGKKVKLEALANHVAKVSRKMFDVPEFLTTLKHQKPRGASRGLGSHCQKWGYSREKYPLAR